MKKATLTTIYETLKTMDYDPEILSEIEAELNKGKARKEANAKAYEDVHDIIVGNLSETPATCGELYDAIKDELPEGFSKGKVQYALTHLWQDEIAIVEGSPNSYRKA